MSEELDRRIADAEWKGKVTQMLENIDAKLDTGTVRMNDHSKRIGSLEQSRSWAMGAGAALGAISGWLAAHFGGNK